MTDEDLRFKKSMDVANKGITTANISIWVAVGIGICSIILSIITLCISH